MQPAETRSTSSLLLLVRDADGSSMPVEVAIERVVLIGYSGRDRDAVQAHIRELERLGVSPPARVPAIYSVPPSLVTTSGRLAVDGAKTSGEAEFVLVPSAYGVLVGVGSDHTDRAREAVDVAEAKARCGKVISHEVWPLQVLEPHWDQLELRAWTSDGSGRRLYQEGGLDALLAPEQLLAEVEHAGLDTTGCLIFGGTLPTMGGLAFGSYFEVELHDPVLERQLHCAYEVVTTVERRI